LTSDQVFSQLSAIRQRGFALDRDRLVDGISALAVPIRPQGRDVTAALAINMTSARLSDGRVNALVALLRREIAAIESAVSPLSFVSRQRAMDRG